MIARSCALFALALLSACSALSSLIGPSQIDQRPASFRGVAVDHNADQSCSGDFDCPFSTACIAPEGATSRGVCGKLVDARGIPATTSARAASGCVFDDQCPAFFSCRLTGGGAGLCVQR